MGAASPWAFHLHLGAWLVVLGLAAAYALAVRRSGGATRANVLAALGAVVAALGALTWPVADLAAHTLLTALVLQRLIFLLAVPPLVLAALPPPLISRLSRPIAVDWVLRRCARPAVAVAVVTLIAAASLLTAAVEAEGSSAWARAALDLALVVAGFVLWTPVTSRLPGIDRPSALGRCAYLMVQSVVPSFLAIVWIFARHPLYPHFARSPGVFGLSALVDQQMAGFVATFGTICVLWTVAFVGLSRAQQAVATGRDPDPLLWSDVERHLERVERRERRRIWLPQNLAAPAAEPDNADHPPREDRA
jgi:cytochrome c oxidase assembly factor CtaG